MNKESCNVCEGIFAYNETKVEYLGNKYREACYEEVKENE